MIMHSLRTLKYNGLIGPNQPNLLEPANLTPEQIDVVNNLDKPALYALIAIGQRISPTKPLPTLWKWCGF